jgi:hypothetical protein
VAAATAAAAAPLVCGAAPAAQDDGGRSRRIPAEIRREALVRARFVCEFCKNRYGAEIHHVIPFSKGGSHELANLIVLCSRCHQKLHDDERRDAGTTDECQQEKRTGPTGAGEPVRQEERGGGNAVVAQGSDPAFAHSGRDRSSPRTTPGHRVRDRDDFEHAAAEESESEPDTPFAARRLHLPMVAADDQNAGDLAGSPDEVEPPGEAAASSSRRPGGPEPGEARPPQRVEGDLRS